MEHWAELRTALAVARCGTVKSAAKEIGVHRATVNRHIETLEKQLGAPLFQRHARGYSLTELGQDMMDVAGRADEMFSDLLGRSHGMNQSLSGSLIITSLSGVAPLIAPVIDAFHYAHPDIEINFVADEELARLEYGEAHVAVRAGKKPETPDYVVLPYQPIRFGLYAAEAYIDRYSLPIVDSLNKHKLVGPYNCDTPLPYAAWMHSHIASASILVRTSNQHVINGLVNSGVAIGFLAEHDAGQSNLHEIIPPKNQWSIQLWLVTHADLRRTKKVQEFIRVARSSIRT